MRREEKGGRRVRREEKEGRRVRREEEDKRIHFRVERVAVCMCKRADVSVRV